MLLVFSGQVISQRRAFSWVSTAPTTSPSAKGQGVPVHAGGHLGPCSQRGHYPSQLGQAFHLPGPGTPHLLNAPPVHSKNSGLNASGLEKKNPGFQEAGFPGGPALLGALGRREAQGRALGTALRGGGWGGGLRAWFRGRLDSTQLCVPRDVSS